MRGRELIGVIAGDEEGPRWVGGVGPRQCGRVLAATVLWRNRARVSDAGG